MVDYRIDLLGQELVDQSDNPVDPQPRIRRADWSSQCRTTIDRGDVNSPDVNLVEQRQGGAQRHAIPRSNAVSEPRLGLERPYAARPSTPPIAATASYGRPHDTSLVFQRSPPPGSVHRAKGISPLLPRLGSDLSL